MTPCEPEPGLDVEPFAGLEVATVARDTLRANVRVQGSLDASTVALLVSVLHTHLSAGRRYVRVDLAAAHITDESAVDALAAAHHRIAALGGMLIFENAGPRVIAAVDSAALFVLGPEA